MTRIGKPSLAENWRSKNQDDVNDTIKWHLNDLHDKVDNTPTPEGALIVEGTVEDETYMGGGFKFTPTNNTKELFDSAYNAIISGRLVLAKFQYGGADRYLLANDIYSAISATYIYFIAYLTGCQNISWKCPQN